MSNTPATPESTEASETHQGMHSLFAHFDSPTVKPPLNAAWAARREVSDALRRLIGHMMTSNADPHTLNTLATSLNQHADRLAEGPHLYGRVAFEQYQNGYFGDLANLGYEMNPLDGKSNPLSPPFTTWVEDNVAHGRANLGWQYEGPPSTVHGGFVCALFDQFLGVAQLMTGQPGVTGTLSTRLHRPTPLDTDLTLIGRVKEVRGRKNIMMGEIWANGLLTASCEGLFVHISKDRFRQMVGIEQTEN